MRDSQFGINQFDKQFTRSAIFPLFNLLGDNYGVHEWLGPNIGNTDKVYMFGIGKLLQTWWTIE